MYPFISATAESKRGGRKGSAGEGRGADPGRAPRTGAARVLLRREAHKRVALRVARVRVGHHARGRQRGEARREGGAEVVVRRLVGEVADEDGELGRGGCGAGARRVAAGRPVRAATPVPAATTVQAKGCAVCACGSRGGREGGAVTSLECTSWQTDAQPHRWAALALLPTRPLPETARQSPQTHSQTGS